MTAIEVLSLIEDVSKAARKLWPELGLSYAHIGVWAGSSYEYHHVRVTGSTWVATGKTVDELIERMRQAVQ
jgi:hypothetical protein